MKDLFRLKNSPELNKSKMEINNMIVSYSHPEGKAFPKIMWQPIKGKRKMEMGIIEPDELEQRSKLM